jgi:tRNA-dihydrouridine synthase
LDWKGEKVGVMEMRPHYANYLKNLPNVKPYRIQLVTTDEIEKIEAIFDKILLEYAGIGAEELVSN